MYDADTRLLAGSVPATGAYMATGAYAMSRAMLLKRMGHLIHASSRNLNSAIAQLRYWMVDNCPHDAAVALPVRE